MESREKDHHIAIVLSAGRGSRMHSQTPKQYLDLCGMPVIAWSLRAFEEYQPVKDIVLVSGTDDIDYCRSEIVERYGFRKVRSIVAGGAERYLSVWEGLKEAARILKARNAGPDREPDSFSDQSGRTGYAAKERAGLWPVVFIHDGARPLADADIFSRCLADACRYGACAAGMPVKDTIKVADENAFALRTPDRRRLWQIQTPQAFAFPLIYDAYRKLIDEGVSDVTDDAMVVERCTSVRVKLTEGSFRNLKITTPEDLEIAKIFLKKKLNLFKNNR